jgi:NAD(P)-dependent dehydrogenase (short-subunit alcohol dehydrogenase family)
LRTDAGRTIAAAPLRFKHARYLPKANFDAWPKVEEVAATILFLASPENKVTRGGVVPVFGASSQSAAA